MPPAETIYTQVTARPDAIGEAELACSIELPARPALEAQDPQSTGAASLDIKDALMEFDERVAPLIQNVKSMNAEAKIFLPPYSPALEEYLQAEIGPQRAYYLSHAVKEANVVTVPQAALDKLTWHDHWHYCFDSGPYVFDQIWPEITPSNSVQL